MWLINKVKFTFLQEVVDAVTIEEITYYTF